MLSPPRRCLKPGQNRPEVHVWLKSQLGFEPGLIRIRRFEHPDALVEIEPLTDRYREFLENPDAVPRNEWAELLKATRQWVTRGEFVLLYNNDYWLDAQGEVTSS